MSKQAKGQASEIPMGPTTHSQDEIAELHRLLIESVQDYAIFALDPKGYILSWNAGAERFKGYKAHEIIGKHFSIFYPEEKVLSGFPDFELQEAARLGRFEDEGWRVKKDGSLFWANVVITALRNSEGRLVGFAKVTRDLSERRKAEEILRQSEERFRLLVTSVKDYAIFMLDPTGRVATWNEGAQRLKGYTEEEIIGKHFSIFYTPERIAEKFPQHELAMAARDGSFEDEGWRVKKDGSLFWANVVITALRNSDGHLVGFAKVTRDLTERRRTEERLRENEERLRLLVNSVKDYAIFMLDPHGNVETWNEGAQRINGYKPEEIIGRHFSTFYTREDIESGKPALELEVASTTGKYEEEGWRLRKDGARFWASVVITAIRSGNRLLGFAKVTRDLTERRASQLRALDDARRFAAEEAGRRAAEERAIELHALSVELRRQAKELEARSRDAEQARARADEANRAKSQFLAAMSHELRTPLNAIGGFADLIDMGIAGPVTKTQHEHLERIRRSQVHLLGIINDILNFSRIEAGQLIYDLAPTPVHDMMSAVATMIEPQAIRKGVRFEYAECPPDVQVLVDRSKTEQILLNLLSNAVKFTDEKGSIFMTCRWKGTGNVQLIVRDTGHGIPRDQLDAIFEPFVQVGRSLTSSKEGTGLGLAISRDLARGMAGDITVTSTIGEGSEFIVTLPRA